MPPLNLGGFIIQNEMKKSFILITLCMFGLSCVTIRFPENIKVDITVPENFDAENIKILVDTLRGINRKGENEINGTVEFLLHKAEKKTN